MKLKKGNLMVGYHGGQLHILPPLLQFTKIIQNELINNLLIGNKRDNIPPFFVDSSSCQTCTEK